MKFFNSPSVSWTVRRYVKLLGKLQNEPDYHFVRLIFPEAFLQVFELSGEMGEKFQSNNVTRWTDFES